MTGRKFSIRKRWKEWGRMTQTLNLVIKKYIYMKINFVGGFRKLFNDRKMIFFSNHCRKSIIREYIEIYTRIYLLCNDNYSYSYSFVIPTLRLELLYKYVKENLNRGATLGNNIKSLCSFLFMFDNKGRV